MGLFVSKKNSGLCVLLTLYPMQFLHTPEYVNYFAPMCWWRCSPTIRHFFLIAIRFQHKEQVYNRSIYIRTVSSWHLLSSLPNKLKQVDGPFGKSNMHSTHDFCPIPPRNEMNVPLHKRKLRAYCPDIYTVPVTMFWAIENSASSILVGMVHVLLVCELVGIPIISLDFFPIPFTP